ncbi:MAG: helix-turn-helix transcriptional regulator [Muribaculaceae bacterium]|nr:helix-turn-helix transcriptional regulator [Muribaculaceae bacterium]MDE6272259.1 helix-turn-helix transcriptional regulator [Muribaculaceae bacterium]
METSYNRIKEVLAERGIKQTWLAEKLGKTQRTVNMYVNNDVQPPIPVLYEIARILKVEVSELLNPSEQIQ